MARPPESPPDWLRLIPRNPSVYAIRSQHWAARGHRVGGHHTRVRLFRRWLFATLTVCRGIEETVSGDPHRDSISPQVATPVLLGFAFMLLVEEYFSSDRVSPAHRDDTQTFQMDLEELEREEGMMTSHMPSSHTTADSTHRAYPLSLGLVVHALVDGYALGVAASDDRSPALSLVVFLAIIIHKSCPFPNLIGLYTYLFVSQHPQHLPSRRLFFRNRCLLPSASDTC